MEFLNTRYDSRYYCQTFCAKTASRKGHKLELKQPMATQERN